VPDTFTYQADCFVVTPELKNHLGKKFHMSVPVCWQPILNASVLKRVLPNVQGHLRTVAEESSLWCMADADELQGLLIRSLPSEPWAQLVVLVVFVSI
jgi:hypothetical protein